MFLKAVSPVTAQGLLLCSLARQWLKQQRSNSGTCAPWCNAAKPRTRMRILCLQYNLFLPIMWKLHFAPGLLLTTWLILQPRPSCEFPIESLCRYDLRFPHLHFSDAIGQSHFEVPFGIEKRLFGADIYHALWCLSCLSAFFVSAPYKWQKLTSFASNYPKKIECRRERE